MVSHNKYSVLLTTFSKFRETNRKNYVFACVNFEKRHSHRQLTSYRARDVRGPAAHDAARAGTRRSEPAVAAGHALHQEQEQHQRHETAQNVSAWRRMTRLNRCSDVTTLDRSCSACALYWYTCSYIRT